MGQPDFVFNLNGIWGGSYEDASIDGILATAAHLSVGCNPPYTATEFFADQPQFGGKTASASGVVASGSMSITGVTNAGSFSPGQLIAAADLAPGTVITAVDAANHTLTISQAALKDSSTENLTVYTKPAVPLTVLNLYITLASSSIRQSVWLSRWRIGMSLFIAHFVELWLIASRGGNTNASSRQVAAAGLARGIQTSKSVGDVSSSSQPLSGSGLEAWGQYQLTIYGQQLISFAKLVGFGVMYIR